MGLIFLIHFLSIRFNTRCCRSLCTYRFIVFIHIFVITGEISKIPKIEWIIDITIAYPNGVPIDLSHIVFGNRPPCRTTIFYKLYPINEVPQDSESLTKWLIDRWSEKENMLTHFYKTGEFPDEAYRSAAKSLPKTVDQDYLRFLILNVFFIASTYIHLQMLATAYHFCSYLVY